MANNNEDMLMPDSSPRTVGTRRVNSNPILIMVTIVITFLLVMIFVANKKSKNANLIEESPIKSTSSSNLFATELTSKHTDGIIPYDSIKNENETDLALPLPDEAADIITFPPLLDSSIITVNVDPERERIETVKMQLFEQSLRSKTAIDNIAPVSSGSANYSSNSAVQNREQILAKIASVRQRINSSASSGDLSEVYKQRLEMIKNAGIVGNSLGTGSELLEGTNLGHLQNEGNWQLENKIEIPTSAYVLRTGFVIPGTLISGINSELPGQIVAQVSQNIYDTATGKYLLIPQGSRLNGTYSSDVSFGQARVMVAWQRIIFPDGRSLDIGSMPGTDSAGYGGLNDLVNNHYLRIFGSAVLLSGVTAGISYSQDRNKDDKSASGAISEALGQQLGQTTTQLINKNMNISPTIEIRPGYRFNIIVTKDMVFSKPYKPFDF